MAETAQRNAFERPETGLGDEVGLRISNYRPRNRRPDMTLAGYQLPIALDVRDVAGLLEIHPETVRRLIAKGELRAVRIGRLVRVPREALTEFLAGGSDAP
jgi:excisionase family DNA binding protein